MKYDSEFVEFVVQEVIRRLMASGASASAPVATETRSGNDAGRELVLNERLITLMTLSGRLNGISRVIVPRRAVVSPAVRDELRSQSIELRRAV